MKELSKEELSKEEPRLMRLMRCDICNLEILSSTVICPNHSGHTMIEMGTELTAFSPPITPVDDESESKSESEGKNESEGETEKDYIAVELGEMEHVPESPIEMVKIESAPITEEGPEGLEMKPEDIEITDEVREALKAKMKDSEYI